MVAAEFNFEVTSLMIERAARSSTPSSRCSRGSTSEKHFRGGQPLSLHMLGVLPLQTSSLRIFITVDSGRPVSMEILTHPSPEL